MEQNQKLILFNGLRLQREKLCGLGYTHHCSKMSKFCLQFIFEIAKPIFKSMNVPRMSHPSTKSKTFSLTCVKFLSQMNNVSFILFYFFTLLFYSGRGGSHPAVCFIIYCTYFLAPFRRLGGKPDSNSGLLRNSLVSPSGLNH
jgi:hypothetical protein